LGGDLEVIWLLAGPREEGEVTKYLYVQGVIEHGAVNNLSGVCEATVWGAGSCQVISL